MRIIQFVNKQNQRCVGLVENDRINVLKNASSTYDLFQQSVKDGITLQEIISHSKSDQYEDYDSIIKEKRIRVPLDHPDPYHTWVTGTGLTHLGSIASRDAMHQKMNASKESITDSMKMFKMGVENGKMKANVPASQPEWFYKGNGLTVVNPEQPLHNPAYALDGGEEPELTGLYIIDPKGNPKRIGFALGNEFSDHKMEQINYLYLAHSKLRECSFGPELFLSDVPEKIVGTTKIIRDNKVLWEKEFFTGEEFMSHNIANLEHHHFKYNLFRQPGDVHVHFLGASELSFTDHIETQKGDVFEIASPEFGRPLRNFLAVE